MAYYAWSPIRHGGSPPDVPGAPVTSYEVIDPGEEVDAGKLGISDEDFAELVEAGSVREEPYPEDVPDGMSVREYQRKQASDAGVAYETTGGTNVLSEVEQMHVAHAAQLDIEGMGDVEEVLPEDVSPEEAQLARTPIVEGKDLSLEAAPTEVKPAPAATTSTE
jgi:hypothetical protein